MSSRRRKVWTMVVLGSLLYLATHLLKRRLANDIVTMGYRGANQTHAFLPMSKPNTNRCSQVLRAKKSLNDYGSIFFHIELEAECSRAIAGGPMDYLPDMRNPCWLGRLADGPLYPLPFCQVPFTSVPYRNFIARMNHKMALSQPKHHLRMRCLPYAFISGVTKGGTTDLFRVLARHPEVESGPLKEFHYWNEYRFGNGWRSGCKRKNNSPHEFMPFSEYVDRFDVAAEAMRKDHVTREGQRYFPSITIDASPGYMWRWYVWKQLPSQKQAEADEPKYILAHTLKEMLPNAKFIVLLRNPVDRAYSDFRRNKDKAGMPPEAFHELIMKEVAAWEECRAARGLRACLYDRQFANASSLVRASLYSVYLDDWLKVYPREQFLFLKSEDYFRDRRPVVERVFDFLGLRTMDNTFFDAIQNSSVHNSRRHDANMLPMLHETRTTLAQYFRPFNGHLVQLLQDERFLW